MPRQPRRTAAQRRRWIPFRQRLLDDLEVIETKLQALLDVASIRNVDPNRGYGGDAVFIGFAKWGWEPADATQLRMRRELELLYNAWWERFRTLSAGIQRETKESAAEANELVRRWIQQEHGDHSVPRSIPEAKAKAAKATADLRAALEVLAGGGEPEVIVVPDTGALMVAPELAAYATAVEAEQIRIIIPTQVIAELDDQKDRGRTADVREQARAVIQRLKGLRDRGDITVGAPVTSKIILTVETKEPSFAELPEHLDPAVPDDRIIAATLAIQARHPAAVVVLVARDLNMQNKAHVVGLPFAEPPEQVTRHPT